MSNNEFMLIGHDNSDMSTWTTTETPYDSVYRVAREYRVTNTGNVGTVRIAVDTSELPTKLANYNLYALIVDQDGIFDSGDEEFIPLNTRSGNYNMASGIELNTGDYFTICVARNRSVQSGNWNDPTTWLSGQIPREEEDILISKGDTVTVTADVEVGGVFVDSAAVLQISSTQEFDITEGDLIIDTYGEFKQGNGHIIYSAYGPQCVGGMTYYQLTVRGSGAKSLCGDITVTNSFLIFEDAPSLSLDVTASNYTITLNCDWRNTGTFIPQDGVVIMDGSNLSIDRDNNGAETFYKLDVRTTGTLTIADHVYISDSLLMNGGVINATTDTLTIGTGLGVSGGIERNSGIITGLLRRWIENTTDTYLYPIGTSTTYFPISTKFNNLSTQGYVFGRYTATDPGDNGLALIYEDSLYMVNVFNEGYWSVLNQSAASNNYDISVTATGFSTVDAIGAGTRLVTRPTSGANWTLNGDHADAVGNVISRNNVHSLELSLEFAIQQAVCQIQIPLLGLTAFVSLVQA
jgi:hypothetical protein